jgi:hypothetical protein
MSRKSLLANGPSKEYRNVEQLHVEGDAMLSFETDLEGVETPEDCWRKLEEFSNSIISFRLFTVMTVDMPKRLARRAYSNMPLDYPVSGTKPITIDHWFDVVHHQKKIFVANTITEIAQVFPDHEKIWALGCGSVVNLPVIIDGEMVATINMLHEEHYYSPERVKQIAEHLTKPAGLAYRRAMI